MKQNVRYDMSATPEAAGFDESAYRQALRQAEAEKIDLRGDVSKLHLVELQDEVLEWARGKRPEPPSSAHARTALELHLTPR